jgi:hypothetical protein
MPRLAEVAGAALPLRFGAVHVTADGLLRIHERPPPSHQRFVLDDIVYHVALRPEGDGTRLSLWAEVGYVPYTAQSPDRRNAVLRVLQATKGLERACFALDRGHKIVALAELVTEEPPTVDAMVYETVRFLQEARPFIRLLGGYL